MLFPNLEKWNSYGAKLLKMDQFSVQTLIFFAYAADHKCEGRNFSLVFPNAKLEKPCSSSKWPLPSNISQKKTVLVQLKLENQVKVSLIPEEIKTIAPKLIVEFVKNIRSDEY